jgi:cell wall-associated NlpC family hydrolase
MGRFRYSRRHGSVPPGVVAAVAAGLLMAGTAGASATHGSGGGSAPPHASSRTAQTAVSYAEAQIGKPYIYGATGPDAFDCSGLAQAAWAAAGVAIPRTSEEQWAAEPHISGSQLRPGDLIFYTGSPIDPPPGHVTMYVGGGQMVEAYGTGYPVRDTAVRPGATGYAQPGGGS